MFPADRRAGLIEDFWTPRAARIALHMVSSLPPRECVRQFRQRGAMCPSVASLVRLHEAAGRRWEEIADDALVTIRDGEDVPREAAVATMQIDGVMVAMGQDKRTHMALSSGRRRRARPSRLAQPMARFCGPCAMRACLNPTRSSSSSW